MQPISFIRHIWIRKIKVRDRFLFSLVLLVLSAFYYYTRYGKAGIEFETIQWEVYTLICFLVSFIVVDFWGDFIVRIWLTVSGVVGQTIFFLLMFLFYFLFLSPVFMIRKLVKKKVIKQI